MSNVYRMARTNVGRCAAVVLFVVVISGCSTTCGAGAASGPTVPAQTPGALTAEPTAHAVQPSTSAPSAPAKGPAISPSNQPLVENLTFSGFVSGYLGSSDDARCAPVADPTTFFGYVGGAVGGDHLHFQIQFPDHGSFNGPGSYGPMWHAPGAPAPSGSGLTSSGTFGNTAGINPIGMHSSSGTLAIKTGLLSGSIDMKFSGPNGENEFVSGTWSCRST